MIKNKLKEIIPKPLLKPMKQIYSKYKIFGLYKYDMKRFNYGYVTDYNKASLDQLDAYLMFYTHSIEKGLSHNNFRANFGKRALSSLSEVLTTYISKGFSKENIRYKTALSALKNYIISHQRIGIEHTIILDIFDKEILNDIETSDIELSGFVELNSKDKLDNDKKNFEELFLNRVSVREYSNAKVDLNLIREAVQISTKSPSVCNRQASRVYMMKTKELIEDVLGIQKGFSGYKLPPVLLLVTATNNMLVSPIERNEAFIDGGIFAMSLLCSLEYKGLAACALNAMLSNSDETKIKEIVGVPKEEALIMFIALGNFKNSVKTPKSLRDPLNKILKEV